MSFDTALARVSYLQTALLPPQPRAATAPAAQAGGFAGALASASAATPSAFGPGAVVAPGGAAVPPGPAGVVAAARGELDLGVVEAPPGSNDGPRIATYRSAAGNPPPGPWCAYFTSWVASQAGTPLGESGQGFGRVDDVWAWAQRSGRAVPNTAGAARSVARMPTGAGLGNGLALTPSGSSPGNLLAGTPSGSSPQPGDLIVWDEHIGVVEAVLPDGRVQTIEGNSSDRVSRRVHPPGSALGYVRLG